MIDFLDELIDKSYVDAQNLSPLVLAYVGDGIFEILVRTYIIKDNVQVNKLNNTARNFVSATSQSKFYRIIKDNLTEEEEKVYKRGRNARSNTKSKNATMKDYIISTGFETLFGYLYLTKQYSRMLELFNMCTKEME